MKSRIATVVVMVFMFGAGFAVGVKHESSTQAGIKAKMDKFLLNVEDESRRRWIEKNDRNKRVQTQEDSDDLHRRHPELGPAPVIPKSGYQKTMDIINGP